MFDYLLLLQTVLAASNFATASFIPSSTPELTPGPSMPSLSSLGLSSESLYHEAYALLGNPRLNEPNLKPFLTQRDVSSECIGSPATSLPDALASLLYIHALGDLQCGVHGSYETIQWVTAGSVQVVGRHVGSVDTFTGASCSEVAAGLAQIIVTCASTTGSVRGHTVVGAGHNWGVYLSSKDNSFAGQDEIL